MSIEKANVIILFIYGCSVVMLKTPWKHIMSEYVFCYEQERFKNYLIILIYI